MDVKFEAFPERVEFYGVSPCIRVSRVLNGFKWNFQGIWIENYNFT